MQMCYTTVVNLLNMCVVFYPVIVSEQFNTFSLPFCLKPNLESLTSLPMQNNMISSPSIFRQFEILLWMVLIILKSSWHSGDLWSWWTMSSPGVSWDNGGIWFGFKVNSPPLFIWMSKKFCYLISTVEHTNLNCFQRRVITFVLASVWKVKLCLKSMKSVIVIF